MLSFKTVVVQLCKFHIIKDERLPSKTEGKTNFSRRLKHFDGLSRLTLTPPYLTTDLRHCQTVLNHTNIRTTIQQTVHWTEQSNISTCKHHSLVLPRRSWQYELYWSHGPVGLMPISRNRSAVLDDGPQSSRAAMYRRLASLSSQRFRTASTAHWTISQQHAKEMFNT